ncbi:aromatic-ring-hydroxylating dioxygenase subunit beta [Variovorax sp. RA8]|uniref:aromatic-ring-hydroxylating dioxygenase subunit beta n=1 Tax=Variovorax sp. (strain JCM 16519 / RA8) TaxID=662548 RepID=UPI001317A4CD|nr:aromatic-ring-hydroxylating dioxygenase subunit beta [Variovorax sp. RA8]VTU17705.1 Salicylate 5-hydroxylase, small oxygenase component [Variovorax sp. RA8]
MKTPTHSLYRQRGIDPVRALALRHEIEDFNAEYCAVLDAGHVEAWPDFFAEDATYRVTARENAELGLPVGLVYAQGRGMMHDRAVAIARTQMFAPRYNLHLVTNTRVTSESTSGEIAAQANFLLLQTLVEGPSTIHMAGTYYDRFVRVDGGLLLKERQAIYDTTIIANDLVYPL